jgi:hypothetical protein
MDAVHATEQQGSNGSINSTDTLKIFKALVLAANQRSGSNSHHPMMIDAGTAEGRAMMHWAALTSDIIPKKDQISLYGFERPGYQTALTYIHKSIAIKAEEKLHRPVQLHVQFKECQQISRLSDEFPMSGETSWVVYSFWTAWFPSDKEKLLLLIASEPKVAAFAIYLQRFDKRSTTGEVFDSQFILEFLRRNSPDQWNVFFQKKACRFIGDGNETANAVVFQRLPPAPPRARPYRFALKSSNLAQVGIEMRCRHSIKAKGPQQFHYVPKRYR